MFRLSEEGAAPVLVLIAALGLVAFLAVSSAAPFKDRLFAQLFPKPASQAATNSVSGPISGSTNPDVIPPSGSITNPTNGSTVKKSSVVNITAIASDNVAVARVEFNINGVLRCLVATAPYNCSWNVPKQPRVKYVITATAFDTAGNSASSSVSVISK